MRRGGDKCVACLVLCSTEGYGASDGALGYVKRKEQCALGESKGLEEWRKVGRVWQAGSCGIVVVEESG